MAAASAAGFGAALILASFISIPARMPLPESEVRPASMAMIAPSPLPLHVQPQPQYPAGYNFALAKNGATATGGKDPHLLIDGAEKYDGGSGFAMTYWNNQPTPFFVVKLKDAVSIDCIRFLLWDLDDRAYRYKLEVCPDDAGTDWRLVADRTGANDFCKSWQVISFSQAQTVKLIRLTGTYNSANNGFHVVELQAFLGAPPKRTSEDALDF